MPVVPLVPPHVRAKQKLQEALALINQPRPFCIVVSDTIRFYLEERFEFLFKKLNVVNTASIVRDKVPLDARALRVA